MKALVLFVTGLLLALPANSSTPAESSTTSAQPADPSLVKPKPIGRHICSDVSDSWMHATSRNKVTSIHVTFQVAADGTVKDVVVDGSSGDTRLDALTVTCVERWRYEPATKDGQPIALPWDATVQHFHT